MDLGFELYCPEMEVLNVHDALEEFREHLGGALCITLLTDIGAAMEVNHIDYELMQSCLQSLMHSNKPSKKTVSL
uniref:hypothetical protein n=1 Tax=Shewanella gaetbuli TaxID=220752 RepID=UPI003B59DCE6